MLASMTLFAVGAALLASTFQTPEQDLEHAVVLAVLTLCAFAAAVGCLVGRTVVFMIGAGAIAAPLLILLAIFYAMFARGR
jgi:hypothetical protein